MRLADFTEDVRRIADAEAFGIALGKGEGEDARVRFVTRHRGGVAAHVFPIELLPSLLSGDARLKPSRSGPSSERESGSMEREGFSRASIIAPLSEHDDASHPFVRRLIAYGVNSFVRIPLAQGAGYFWAGLREAELPGAGPMRELEELTARMSAALAEPEPAAARLDRLEKIDVVDQVLPVVASALDVREVFGRLSEIARAVVPHDAATIQLLVEDETALRLYALDGIPRTDQPEIFPTPYDVLLNRHAEFSIDDDLRANASERERPAARTGVRSAVRVPLWLGDRIGGTLELCSTAVGSYHEEQVPIVRRIADYVSVAISHQRMAEQGRGTETLRARSEAMFILDELLATLTGALDARQIFHRIQPIALKVIPHDGMTIGVLTTDETRATVFASEALTGMDGAEFEVPAPNRELLATFSEPQIVEDLPGHLLYRNGRAREVGMLSAMMVPIWVDGRLRGAVNFFSRQHGQFTPDHILIARRIGDHLALAVSHERLAHEEQSSAELKARAANVELLDELLAALTEEQELSREFDRISAIVKKVIPHDAMIVPVMLPDGLRARRYASSGLDLGSTTPIIDVPPSFIRDPNWEYDIVDDVAASGEAHNRPSADLGFRSVLRVPIRVNGKVAAGVAFIAREPGVYKLSDLPIARRIADRIALCLARERQLEATKREDEASSRASQLESRVRALTDELDARYQRVIGKSPSWTRVLGQAAQVAATEATVLLLGESGTGKEVVARFVHRASRRASGPFVALNCAALPEQLLEAELFGYERGAFTGAMQSKPGQLEQAGGGTLFLDEVGEMSPAAQAKFLRVLQEREFQRLGGTRVLRTDARVVAATNRDLQLAIERGQFREDLFYRLNVFAIELPPLRERKEDVLPLSEAFLTEYGRSLGRPPSGISRDARSLLMDYHWPGNVRELRNVLERAAILCDGGLITAEHLALLSPVTPRPAPSATPALPAHPALPAPPADLGSMERSMIEEALKRARFNKSRAAAALGLTRGQLYVRMRRYGIADKGDS